MEQLRRGQRPTVSGRRPDRRFVAARPTQRVVTDVRRQPHPEDDIPLTQQPPVVAPPAVTPRSHHSSKARPALPRTARSFVLRRQIKEGAATQRKKSRRVHREHVLTSVLILIVVVALGVVAWSFRELLPTARLFNKPKETPVVQQTPKSTTSSLDETPVTAADITAHVVPDDQPKTLRIPKLQLAAQIRRVGTSLGGEPILPINIFDAGWFDGSSKPNMSGAILLNGHIAGPTKAGLFARLGELITGDIIEIECGNGQLISYAVVKVQRYQTTALDMSAAVSSIDPAKQGLNLVTAVNKYAPVSDKNTQRIIVFALRQ